MTTLRPLGVRLLWGWLAAVVIALSGWGALGTKPDPRVPHQGANIPLPVCKTFIFSDVRHNSAAEPIPDIPFIGDVVGNEVVLDNCSENGFFTGTWESYCNFDDYIRKCGPVPLVLHVEGFGDRIHTTSPAPLQYANGVVPALVEHLPAALDVALRNSQLGGTITWERSDGLQEKQIVQLRLVAAPWRERSQDARRFKRVLEKDGGNRRH